MDVPGEAYLFNVSVVAVTFAAVSVLVMLMRQTMGGKLSNFDIHLVVSYVSRGFVIVIVALLPSLFADFGLSPAVFWAVASGSSAVLFAAVMATTLWQRTAVTHRRLPPVLMFLVGLQWVSVVLLGVNAAVPALQGIALYKAAVTLSLAAVLWQFVRRISSLLGENPGDDWDPKRG